MALSNCPQPLVEFLTEKGIRMKNAEKADAARPNLQSNDLQTDEDDDDYGGDESETGNACCNFHAQYLVLELHCK